MRLDWVGCCIVGGVLEKNARERAQTSHIYIIIKSGMFSVLHKRTCGWALLAVLEVRLS